MPGFSSFIYNGLAIGWQLVLAIANNCWNDSLTIAGTIAEQSLGNGLAVVWAIFGGWGIR